MSDGVSYHPVSAQSVIGIGKNDHIENSGSKKRADFFSNGCRISTAAGEGVLLREKRECALGGDGQPRKPICSLRRWGN